MEKLYTPNFFRIILVEGLWGVGKTTLIENLLKIFHCKFIQEPNHLNKNIKNRITEWYFKEHKRRLISALKSSKRENVILERSSLSSISYRYALTGDFPKESDEIFSLLKNLENLSVIFLYAGRRFTYKKIGQIRDITIKKAFENKNFYRRYLSFYTKILSRKINKEVISLKVDHKGSFVPLGQVFKKVLQGL